MPFASASRFYYNLGNAQAVSGLDAPAHHPFLPSKASSPTGFTQHLVTGEPDVPELIHCAFPAAKIRGAMASMRLKNDPPESYKVRRLP